VGSDLLEFGENLGEESGLRVDPKHLEQIGSITLHVQKLLTVKHKSVNLNVCGFVMPINPRT
jgi:hypothetical protein